MDQCVLDIFTLKCSESHVSVEKESAYFKRTYVNNRQVEAKIEEEDETYRDTDTEEKAQVAVSSVNEDMLTFLTE